uniref:Ankyrin n=1 Tax=Cyclopterus lumpus TaxID=8103 RepID=A0A8C2XSH4_CYCLU
LTPLTASLVNPWNDCLTPLIAAVVYHNRDIFTFLLQQGVDPNRASQTGLTPLHYVSLSKAPVLFVEKLLKAKAEPNVWNPFTPLTPLQTAAINDRKDVFKVLLSAGALVTLLPPTDPEYIHNRKISQMIHTLASKGERLCSKIRYFIDLEIAVQEGSPEEGRARLADFGISRRLDKGQTTYCTSSAGTKCWMAKETLADEGDIPYKSSTDIQVGLSPLQTY